jgi:hypothetical protein
MPELLSCEEAKSAGGILAARVPHVADVAPANLFLFRREHDYRLHRGSLPYISGRAYDGTRLIIPLCALADADPAKWSELLGQDGWLYPLRKEDLPALPRGWQVHSNPDDSDYVFRTGQLASLSGTRDRQRQAARFIGSGRIKALTFDDPAAPALALQVLDGWQAQSGKDPSVTDLANGREAIGQVGALKLFGEVVLCDDAPVGFVLASMPWPDMMVIHFAKGLAETNGVYPAMFSRIAARPEAPVWTNFEQDLGNPRFRQAKRAYGPDHLLAKYRARPA